MSDHVTMIHQGRVTMSGPLDDARLSVRRSRVRFGEPFARPPALDGVLAIEGSGRTWSVVHDTPLDVFTASVQALGGEVIDSRGATLEEIFLARAGRQRQQAEAA